MSLPMLARARIAAAVITGKAGSNAVESSLAALYPNGGPPPSRTTKDFLRAYSTQPWLRAVTHKVSHSVATVPWCLYAVKREGKFIKPPKGVHTAPRHIRRKMLKRYAGARELTELEEHPMLDMLEGSNPTLTGLMIRQLLQIYIDLVGECFWLLERNAFGMPVQVWPIPPHWVRETPSPGKPRFLIEYAGKREEIPMTEIIWFQTPDPENPYARGTGTAMSLGDELQTDEYAARFTKSWFYNSARPDLIITPAGDGGSDTGVTELKRLEQAWLQRHQGFFRAFKPFFSSRKIDVHQLTSSFQSMQLTELRKHQRDMLVSVFGVPPEMLGILSSSNRATIEAADYMMQQYVVLPRLELIRSVLQERVAPLFDERIIVDFEDPVMEDKLFHLEVAKAAPWVLQVEEWREMAGREPFDDDKINKAHVAPLGVRLVEDLSELIAEEGEVADSLLNPADPFSREDTEDDDEDEE
jgi:phage portal protein BeeE